MTTMTIAHHFETITLDELVETASLQHRIDRKYAMPDADTAVLIDLLPASTRVLDIDDVIDQPYLSHYFDTPDLASYLGAARRRPRRFKVRTRQYTSGETFVEVKVRKGEHTLKSRTPIDASEQFGIPARVHDFVVDSLALGRVTAVDPSELSRVLTTRYNRTTLLLPSGARVTIDRSLNWALPDGRSVSQPGLAIVETKTPSAASEADRLAWSMGRRPTRLSKYATGLAALRPDLPDHPWLRTLNVWFRS